MHHCRQSSRRASVYLSQWSARFSMPKDLRFTSVTYFFIFFFFYCFLDLRTGEWTAGGYVTNSWWGMVLFLILYDWILHLVALFSGR